MDDWQYFIILSSMPNVSITILALNMNFLCLLFGIRHTRGSRRFSYRNIVNRQALKNAKCRIQFRSFRQIHNWIYMRFYDKTITKKLRIDHNTINVNNSNSNINWSEQHKYFGREWKFDFDNSRRSERENEGEETKFYVQSNHCIILISFWRTTRKLVSFCLKLYFQLLSLSHWAKQSSADGTIYGTAIETSW